mmetsp:Transcript_91953/g.268903  ORF Transcript_91953/g.268903 Transcript_91953/m.268903 type:complete len:475 (+) Transcript_91953:52-1476(+)
MFEPNQAYYVISVGQGTFLDTHGRSACLWNNNGKDVDAIIAENISHTSPAAGNIRWRLLICPHQPNAVYIVNDRHKAFLDTHGTDLSIWNNRGQDIAQIIAGNTSKYAGNIRWRILDCPHQPGTAYIVNVRHGKLLDADCGDLSLWNNGRDVDTVIAENTSRFAANIRWQILCVPLGTEGISHAPATLLQPRLVRIVHLSDTHGMHWSIEPRFPLPEGDILVHTGDFSNHGSDAEIADFDRWLGEVGPRYRHVVVIPGNHDWWGTLQLIEAGHLDPQRAVDPNFMQQKFQNCRVLCQEEVTLEGVRLFGCSWCPWQRDGGPDKFGHSSAYRATAEAWEASGGRRDVFCQVPQGLDVLLTHGPAHGILDCIGTPGRGWGSSRSLLAAIVRAKPRMHLFGHLHEQRGQWRRGPSGFEGGVEYDIGGQPFPTSGPPPLDYPCDLVSCNAMSNHPRIDGTDVQSIAGPARLICVTPRG